MPSNLMGEELVLMIIRNSETYPFEIKSTEKAQVNVFIIELSSIVFPQERRQFSGQHVDFAILEFLPSSISFPLALSNRFN